MPRANRHYMPGYIWHIAHRCHKKEYLLKFARDRRNWLKWLYVAKQRYGLCILNYALTSNHVHLLVLDKGKSKAISESMRLVAGRSGQEYNQRKERRGAFWEDRYHATAVEDNSHFIQCLVYIDLNMVRAGVVNHPGEWPYCGYNEILGKPLKFGLIDEAALMELLKMNSLDELRASYSAWIESRIEKGNMEREAIWTESVAVGSEAFVRRAANNLGIRATGKEIINEPDRENGSDTWLLQEEKGLYKSILTPKRAI
jgi:putative transposase